MLQFVIVLKNSVIQKRKHKITLGLLPCA